eukprot:GILJ01005640.1.p1 GENE.GILJ01005640.1~~GILJ01005640.1.p1  ORF type:complete len:233 (+),score=25.36 GILJ01005640.1:147-845(+)
MAPASVIMRDTKYDVFVLNLVGADSGCGCPILCVGETLQAVQNDLFLPPELKGVYSLDEFKHFTNEVNHTLHNTHWPIMPCIFTHFCIPFSPVCAMMCCSSRRTKLLRGLLKDESSRMAKQGLYWEFVTVAANQPLAVLKLNPDARLLYESENLQARKLVKPDMVDESAVVQLPMYPVSATIVNRIPMVQPMVQPMGMQMGHPVAMLPMSPQSIQMMQMQPAPNGMPPSSHN